VSAPNAAKPSTLPSTVPTTVMVGSSTSRMRMRASVSRPAASPSRARNPSVSISSAVKRRTVAVTIRL
jgi:hypothetical protein